MKFTQLKQHFNISKENLANYIHYKMISSKSSWQVGDVIMTSHPFVHVLMHQERDKRCGNCFNSLRDLLRCSACGLARYCNTVCQRQSWKYHRLECRNFRRISPNIPKESVLLFIRILQQLDCEDGSQACEKVFGVERRFADLVSHIDRIKSDTKRCEEFLQLCATLKAFIGDDFRWPGASKLLEIFGKMVINTFSICDAEMQPIGAGIYLGPSILDHSCRPNAVAVFSGTTLHVRCTQPISDGEQVLISYIDQLDTTADRRNQLEADYYFTCLCPACEDESTDEYLHSSRCPTLNCSAPILQHKDEEFMTCSKCGVSQFDKDYLDRKMSASVACKMILTNAKQLKHDGKAQQLLELCEHCLVNECSILHQLNVHHIKLLDQVFDACIDVADWQKAVSYGSTLVQLYRHYLPTYHSVTGVHLMKLGKIQLFLEQLCEAEVSLRQAMSIISVTHGQGHALCADLDQLLEQCIVEQRCSNRQQPHLEITDSN